MYKYVDLLVQYNKIIICLTILTNHEQKVNRFYLIHKLYAKKNCNYLSENGWITSSLLLWCQSTNSLFTFFFIIYYYNNLMPKTVHAQHKIIKFFNLNLKIYSCIKDTNVIHMQPFRVILFYKKRNKNSFLSILWHNLKQ